MTMPSRSRQRVLIPLVQVLGLCVWFSATAVVPSLQAEWGIGSTEAVWLTASVQVGFVAGAIVSALLNLADRISTQSLLAAAAFGAAACTALMATCVHGLAAAVPLRFLTGFLLAGVYPVGMKLTASWSESTDRGRAFGVLIGALTLGSALPHLISGMGPLPWRAVMMSAAALTAFGAIVAALWVRPGPHLDTRPLVANPRYAITMFRDRGPRLANLGYFGHMWELYALWTWMSVFIMAGRQERGAESSSTASLIAFAAIGLAGVGGCLLGGWASDRFGRPPAAVVALVVSGTCCVLSPLFFTAPTPVLVTFLLVWGASVIADSGVFSTVLSETVDRRFVGTALTAQTAIGFLLTVVTIQLLPVAAETFGWRYAFLLLAPGPVVGAIAMSVLSARFTNNIQEEKHDQPVDPRFTAGGADRGALTHRR
ncbi:MFS transporter [Mycolicibacterium goodii]|uniref:MFS transporter n=1 Tax=Mycolicibacterium goodii TaxID=134601 RepID=UPI001BDBDD2B|nr:MFS transporter [Mycolicibacterium goodii]MBU8819673.1 MFS transporter [Mycolicibacterium goodii]MBU8833977.1 MFS transporter [Mycolicibacterium goodii]